jgi:DUF4097 and DUF4098 domain-containing protein YvlB
MHRRLWICALISTSAALAWDGDRYKEDFRHSFPLNSNGRVSLEGFNGSIEVTGWDRNEIEITGTKYASSEEFLKAIKINISNTPDSITVRTDRPNREGGSWFRNEGGGVRFIVRVPRKAQLDRVSSSNGSIRLENVDGNARLNSSNGTIRANRVNGNLEVSTSNGGIELLDINGGMNLRTSNGTIRVDNAKGAFEAQTSNGAIRARLDQIPPASMIRAISSNGTIDLTLPSFNNNEVRATTSNSSITVHLPSTVNAQLHAATSNANITSDFDVTIRGALSKNRLDGKLGNGGGLIDLTSSNGSIKILKM